VRSSGGVVEDGVVTGASVDVDVDVNPYKVKCDLIRVLNFI